MMIMKRLYLIIFMLSMVASGASAQVDRQDVRRGNRDFRKENYREAEIDYRKALVKDSLSLAANYNLANALYREGDMANAAKALEQIKEVAPSSASASDYYYNVGDVAIAQQNWQGAVDAFRQSLILNPDDLDAKENYIYAKKKLEEQQNQQQNQDNQNQDNKNDPNQDNQDQDQNNDQNQDDQNQNDQNQDQKNENQDQKNQPQQGQEPKITPQAAQQMLKAIQAKEKETQDKVNRQKAEALKSRQKEKNW
ncbi:MAG: tetratricopeptide repeat protein [Bacteroidales bacterium]|nr:tetratricopeptide repeat protein [Bacteroidales bacterium]